MHASLVHSIPEKEKEKKGKGKFNMGRTHAVGCQAVMRIC
jgi:hypothetical protein